MPRPPTNLVPNPPKKPKPRDPVASGERDAAVNRAAGHNYFLLEKFEAGMVLRGTEVKSIREGKANLRDAYGLVKDGEAFLLNLHIGPYSHGSYTEPRCGTDPQTAVAWRRSSEAAGQSAAEGPDVDSNAPLFSQWSSEMRAGRCKGKQNWDKRETERRREGRPRCPGSHRRQQAAKCVDRTNESVPCRILKGNIEFQMKTRTEI